MSPAFRKATREDLPSLIQIERASFSNPHWQPEDFLRHDCVVAEIDGRIAGFLVSRETVPSEREILNLAIAPAYRRVGIATALLKHQLNHKIDYFLEVRESNAAAQALYRRIGFVEVGRRPNYYESPRERAIVMKMKWC